MLYLKDGKDVHGNKIELLILDDKIDKISEGFSEEEIKNIEVTKEVDDEEYCNDAEKCVLPAIIEKQSPDVDTVSGSTYSSKGLIDAVTDALSKAK